MTLRQLIRTLNIDDVYRYIWEKDQNNIAECDRPTMQNVIQSYGKVIQELVNKPKAKAYTMPICVGKMTNPGETEEYIDSYLLNRSYVPPRKGLKPWGTRRGCKTPKGYYNVNANKHSKRFAMGMTSWSKLIDTQVIINDKIEPTSALAEILWELTFYGWTEEQHDEGISELNQRLEESLEEIKTGKYIEVPPSKDGEFTVVIPNSVSKQIADISNGKQKKK